MRKINLLIFLLILTASTFAQTKQSTDLIKVALIDSESFYDEKDGIKKLAFAERQMEMTDCVAMFRYSSLTWEIEKLEKEITVLQSQKSIIIDKLIQLQTLKDESKKAQDENRACKANLRLITIEPIINDIHKKLKEFAKSNSYDVVIDKSAAVSSIIEGEVEDITTEFIKFCNESFEKEKTQ